VLIPPLQNGHAPQRFIKLPKPTPLGQPLVELLGRRKGVVPFLLGLFGMKATARLVVTRDEVNCETTTFTGRTVELIPLSKVADVHVAEYRSIPRLGFGGFAMAFGTVNYFAGQDMAMQITGLVLVMIGLALVVAYFLKRRLMFAVLSGSGYAIAVILETSKIKGRFFQLADLVDIQRIIRQLSAGNVPGPDEIYEEPSGPDFDGESGEDDAEDSGWQTQEFAAPRRPSAVEMEQSARRWFDEARQRSKQGDRDGAVQLLRQLIAAYPETTPAEQARASLAKIGLGP